MPKKPAKTGSRRASRAVAAKSAAAAAKRPSASPKHALEERIARALEAIYLLVFFDALRVKIRDVGLFRNKAVHHIALGVGLDGTKETLGLWPEQNEGAKFRLRVMNQMMTRGLKSFPGPIVAVFPEATQKLNRPSFAPQPRLLKGPQGRGGGAHGRLSR